jgi:hypothetical protein
MLAQFAMKLTKIEFYYQIIAFVNLDTIKIKTSTVNLVIQNVKHVAVRLIINVYRVIQAPTGL